MHPKIGGRALCHAELRPDEADRVADATLERDRFKISLVAALIPTGDDEVPILSRFAAGAAALTPCRLAAHEDALVGLQFRSANVFGSFRSYASYVSARATEWDFEQDVFGAVRVAPRAQLALLVPLVETYRRAQGVSDGGAGLGDVNLSGRYEFVLAGESRYVPGIEVGTHLDHDLTFGGVEDHRVFGLAHDCSLSSGSSEF